MREISTIGTSSLLVWIACQVGCLPSSDGLSVDRHDDSALAGTYDADGVTVQFTATTTAPLTGSVEVGVGDVTLRLHADAASGEIRFEPTGALTADDRTALVDMSLALDSYLGEVEDVDVMHASLLRASARYFAEAPVGTTLNTFVSRTEGLDRTILDSTSNDGKSCIKRGTTVTAYFDGSRGTTAQSWVVGSNGGVQWNGDYSCMGRCGTGCGSYDWTRDCLEHDACSRSYYSTTGPADSNCGDEYEHAADDYAAFWKRCYGS